MHFSEEQNDVFERDLDRLFEVWKTFIAEKVNGSELEGHLPPALLKACSQIFMGLMGRIHEVEGGFAVALDEHMLGSLLANLFEFGQYAYKQGITIDGMAPCDCGTKVTDEDIRKFFNARLN